jgi:hypothetical protein
MRLKLFLLSLSLFLYGCGAVQTSNNANRPNTSNTNALPTKSNGIKIKNESKVAHVLVALCDNENQGIVPVPPAIGNGEDAARNLYWGAGFGVRSFFKKKKVWQLLAEINRPNDAILERLVFKHKTKNVYLVADAYRGIEIKRTTIDFFASSAGAMNDAIEIKDGNKTFQLGINGNADLIAYIGHDGLMDFQLEESFAKQDEAKRDTIMLACISKSYFAEHLRKAGANPLLWTTGLMAPEAYVLHAALEGWINGEDGERIRNRAAAAYNSYQRCGLKAAQKLFATGW